MSDPGISFKDVNGDSRDLDDTKASTFAAMSTNTTETIMMTTPQYSLEKANFFYKKVSEDFRFVKGKIII